ncbi:MAG: CPBP family intramembrane glutamic endopeptidase [Candidatus Thorarchaeota archaeon]
MNRLSNFTVFLLCGLAIFVIPIFLVDPYRIIYAAAITIIFLISYLWASKNETLTEYLQVLQVFFIASLVFMIQFYWSSGTSVEEIVFNKLVSMLVVIIPIILLVKMTTNDLDGLYLKRGNLRLGIIIGGVTILFFALTAIPVSIELFGGQSISTDRLLFLIPWITLFILMNSLKEELLFRGLFLKKYESVLSPDTSNLLQAVIFSLAHLQPVISPFVMIYLVLTFFLGLGFGGVMQKTDSLLGSILFHAAADIPVILAVFSFL